MKTLIPRRVNDLCYRIRSFIDRRFLRSRVVRRLHRVYYDSGVDRHTNWLGIPVWKCPLDLWSYQEILVDTSPVLIIECGTAMGGSALFLANMCDIIDKGSVLSIDIQNRQSLPEHPRIHYVIGSSVKSETLQKVKDAAYGAEQVMVILDSDHSREHVLNELRFYSPFVTSGNYLVVEDSNINGNPVLPVFGPGPMEAINTFLRETSEFVADMDREKFMLTYNPRGFLRRI